MSPKLLEGGQDPKEESEERGGGALGSEKGLSIHWPKKAPSLTPRAFVELSRESDHSV